MDETLRRVHHTLNALNIQVSNSVNTQNRHELNINQLNEKVRDTVNKQETMYRLKNDLSYNGDKIALESFVKQQISMLRMWTEAMLSQKKDR